MKFESTGRVAALALLLALTGCHPFRALSRIGGTCHDSKPYMVAKSVAPLQIPTGLDPVDTSTSLRIPKLNEPELPPRKGTDPCLDEPPAYSTPKPPVPQARSMIRPLFRGAAPELTAVAQAPAAG